MFDHGDYFLASLVIDIITQGTLENLSDCRQRGSGLFIAVFLLVFVSLVGIISFVELVKQVGDEVGGVSDDFVRKVANDRLKGLQQVFVVKLLQHRYVNLQNILEMLFGAV